MRKELAVQALATRLCLDFAHHGSCVGRPSHTPGQSSRGRPAYHQDHWVCTSLNGQIFEFGLNRQTVVGQNPLWPAEKGTGHMGPALYCLLLLSTQTENQAWLVRAPSSHHCGWWNAGGFFTQPLQHIAKIHQHHCILPLLGALLVH